ncbi:MAG: DeoR family transcriptional regulator [Lachnospiraceae bacterium]|jgi:DNA-binding transcriptional ArsR family regulator|nr:DeoR family transcriptional regulator [Lachnospiraceae bacterium]MCI9661160.1 DeoR family transcriptional regulator [Lachnospiraceae bacterium]
MDYEFMITGTPLPPCMPLPRATLRLPVSNTTKVMYARLLDEILTRGTEDCNGILFIRFPIMELSAAISRSHMTVKRSLKELEGAGLILRVRQGIGEPNKIYVLVPKTEDNFHE